MPRAEIQPCGFLVVLGQDWRVRHVSANIADHFADCGPRMIGQPLSEYFGGSAVHSLRNQLALMRNPEGAARLFSLFFASVPKPFDVSMHFKDGLIILEALPSAHVEAGDPAGMARQLAASLDACETVTDLVQRASHLLRALTGFDSVTIFRLDENGEGERIAEEGRGAPIPATHCPPPEVRVLADASRAAIPLEPDAPTSLVQHALLRAIDSGEPCASAKEASTSLFVPLVSAGIPWGVAVCFNRTARQPTLDRIAAAELFGDFLAMRAELCEARAG
ncbi:GAF domain-containing protein [Sphingomonas alba]|uniref:GAF domain-containing protein n=1 Tax=Sphingomonas alba TaxID=2908208 RepID=A0ABT0RLB9_9SPHN|nr:GAF domain-containing protein [Sphingomonas alba]MCL6683069.1 GAF domain-containing protein [Sphingomonas alba]